MNVGLLQLHNTADIANNKQRLAEGIIDLAHRGAELIVLQELHNSLYFCQVEDVDLFDLAEPIPGPSTDFYGKLAKDLGVVIVTSLFERRAPGLYHNTAVVMEKDGSIAGKYRKMHIPDDPAYYEKFYFTPGDLGFHPIQTSVGKLGVLVCWDQWYPEAARLMALQGAEMLIYPTAIGYATYDTEEEQQRQREAWTTVMRGHAVANGLPVIAVNRVGFEPDPSGQTEGIQFWGSSFVAGPQGELHYRASDQEEESLVVDIDLKHSENVRRWWPFLRDRRIENYGDITKRFKNLAQECNIPIVLLCQLNRESAKEGRSPQLTDLRDSGSIEQDADIVIMLERPKDEFGNIKRDHIDLWLRKNRGGQCNFDNAIHLVGNSSYSDFKEETQTITIQPEPVVEPEPAPQPVSTDLFDNQEDF